MVLPLYLAMTVEEMTACAPLPPNLCWMDCRFSPNSPGLEAIPASLPPGAILILSDRLPYRDHDPARIAEELAAAAEQLHAGGVLLDFEQKPTGPLRAVAERLSQALPCPLAAPPSFAVDLPCAVFLPPCPLHVPLADYLRPWQDRRIWLDMTMQQQTITVSRSGCVYGPVFPADRQDGGWFDEILLCRCITKMPEDQVQFLLFDTPHTLKAKLEQATALGVTRAVGLYQELSGKL